MRGVVSQYLNIWHLAEPKTVGIPVIDAEAWGALLAGPLDRVPDAVAVESGFLDGVSVAYAWKPASGPVVVSVTDHPDLPTAVAPVAASGVRRPVLAGPSLTEHAAWTENRVRFTKMSDPVRSRVGALMRHQLGRAACRDRGCQNV